MGDRADRLNQRRRDTARSEAQSDQQTPTSSGESESESDQQSGPAGSIKDQYKGIYMFLPEDLHQEFNIVASELDTQRQRRNGKEVEKIRHVEPLVVALGLEQIDALDEDELEEHLAEFDPE
jgi:hypothetical protein